MEKLFPLEIPVSVGGKSIRAIIFDRTMEADTVSFHVRFNDGFEDFFYLAGEDDQLGPIGKKKGWELYGPSLKSDLRIIRDLQDGQFIKQFTHALDGISSNIWLVGGLPGQDEGDHFYVYYHGECRFRMNSVSVLKNYSGDEDVNSALAKKAHDLLTVNV